jgi:RimJ/RimL family protein N-acetyltransferase
MAEVAQVAEVALRLVEDSDLDSLFDQMRDPESVQMAAFTAEDPDDRAAFDAHMAKVRTSPDVTTRAVTCDGRLVGTIACFVVDGDTEISYAPARGVEIEETILRLGWRNQHDPRHDPIRVRS